MLDARSAVDVVFPVLHGPYGEDGTVQGLLELANIPYVGPGVLASAAGMDKAVMKVLFAGRGLPVCAWHGFVRAEWDRDRNAVLGRSRALGLPGVRQAGKPRIERRHLEGEDARRSWCRRSRLALAFDRKVVVEAAVPNAREIECAVLGNDDPETSMPGEIIPSREFYDYEAKYLDEGSRIGDSRGPPAATVAEVQRLSIEAFRAIDAAGLARVDFLLARDSGDDLPERNQHHARLHRRSACIRRCGKPRRRLRDARRSADPTGARPPRRKATTANQRAVKHEVCAGASLPAALCLGVPRAMAKHRSQESPPRRRSRTPTI